MRRSATKREKARPGRAGHSEDLGQVALARSCWPRRAKPPTTKQGESESALERYIYREQRRQRKQVQVCQLAAATRASTTSPSRLSILQQGTASWLQARKPRTPNGRLPKTYTRVGWRKFAQEVRGLGAPAPLPKLQAGILAPERAARGTCAPSPSVPNAAQHRIYTSNRFHLHEDGHARTPCIHRNSHKVFKSCARTCTLGTREFTCFS